MTRHPRCVPSIIIATAASLGTAVSAPAGGPKPFSEEGLGRGIEYLVTQGDWGEQYGCGLAFADLDGDDDPDLVLLGRADGVVGVYENDGSGMFTDRSAVSGIDPQPMPSGVTAADYDGDGDLDLYVTNWLSPNVLLRNDGGLQFTDVADEAGVADPGPSAGCAWGDYDGDERLDLYVANRNLAGVEPGANRLYRNLGGGVFDEVGAALGVDVPDEATFQPVFFDHDRDGDADLYLSTDKAVTCIGGAGNHLYENVAGVFVDITDSSGTAACIDSMGVAVGDFDRNGLPDLYCTNIPAGNPLFMNLGKGVFTEQSVPAGVASFANGWGAAFLDVDHDGHLDLYVCNDLVANRLYHGGSWPCPDVAAELGVADPGESFCMAVADVDADGDLDLAVQNRLENVRLYINGLGSLGSWARFRITGRGDNLHAVGALVDLRTGDDWQQREVRAGSSYKSQDELTVHFGLADAALIDEVHVTWPGGIKRTLYGLEVDRTRWIHPPAEGGDVDGDGDVDVDDLTALILGWGPCPDPPASCHADVTADGTVDVDDLLALLLHWGG